MVACRMNLQLIINADDLGAGAARDRGIFNAYFAGAITSASLLPNGPSAAEAACTAKDCSLPLGVHLNLSEGRSLTGAIGGLTDDRGNFPGKDGLRQRLAAGRVDAEAMAAELRAQVDHLCSLGVAPDHLDTHQHFFLFPAATSVVIELARAFGIAVRRPLPAEPAEKDPPGDLGKEMALYRDLAPGMNDLLNASGLAAPAGLWGMPLLNRLDGVDLLSTLENLPPGIWELMVHPGYSDSGNPFSGPERERELAALTSPAAGERIRRRGIHLITFGDLRCAS
jgi:chitin disaccharide deacetylase